MPASRIIFMGTPEFAVPALRQLAAHPRVAEVVAVVTQPDRPAGRGRKLTPSAVKRCAEDLGLPVMTPTRIKTAEYADSLRALRPDFIVVAAYGRILPQAILDVPRVACVNIHASLLPELRGASPIAHALWRGDAETGVSIMQMEAGLDTGPVYSTARLYIPFEDTCGTLTARLAPLGGELLLQTLPKIATGELKPVPQDARLATYAPPLRKADGRIDWRAPSHQLARQVRAFDPWPGSYTFVGGPDIPAPGIRMAVLAAQVEPMPEAENPPVPGTVLAAGPQGVVIACGEGGLRLLRVKPEGKGEMTAGAWFAGRGITQARQFDVASSESP